MRTGICCSKFYITRRILEEWISNDMAKREKKKNKNKNKNKVSSNLNNNDES